VVLVVYDSFCGLFPAYFEFSGNFNAVADKLWSFMARFGLCGSLRRVVEEGGLCLAAGGCYSLSGIRISLLRIRITLV
jgi:hypothetical protein